MHADASPQRLRAHLKTRPLSLGASVRHFTGGSCLPSSCTSPPIPQARLQARLGAQIDAARFGNPWPGRVRARQRQWPLPRWRLGRLPSHACVQRSHRVLQGIIGSSSPPFVWMRRGRRRRRRKGDGAMNLSSLAARYLSRDLPTLVEKLPTSRSGACPSSTLAARKDSISRCPCVGNRPTLEHMSMRAGRLVLYCIVYVHWQ